MQDDRPFGNDIWGVELGDSLFEGGKQVVDRLAFLGIEALAGEVLFGLFVEPLLRSAALRGEQCFEIDGRQVRRGFLRLEGDRASLGDLRSKPIIVS